MKPQNEDDIFGEEGESKTAFNSALDIIQRISRLEYSLTSCFLESPFEDLIGAYKVLVLIHTEIDFKLNEIEKKELQKLEEEIRKNLQKASDRYYYNGRYFPRFPELRLQVLLELIELKKKISQLKYKVGLGMIDLSDPRYALLNG
jgi:hypothetical protein